MFSSKSVICIAVLTALLLCATQSAQAVMVTTNGSATYDSGGFEGETAGNQPSSPLVGSYTGATAATIVSNSVSPGAAQGSQYLHINAAANLHGILTTPASGTDLVYAQTMVYIPNTNTSGNGLSLRLTGNNVEASIRMNGAGLVQYEDTAWTNSTVAYTVDTWQLWEMQLDMATGLATFWVNGVQGPVFTPNQFGASPTVDFLRMNSSGGTGGVFLDSMIPEPASLGLLGLGGALMLLRRRP